jgi:hypothetical protein
MNSMMRLLMIAVLVAGARGGIAHAQENAELARLRSEITALVGPARCSNLVNCRIAALGVDACGGPKEYLVYSWRSTDQAALDIKIAEYNLAQEDVRKKDKGAGACTALPQPVAACLNGRCVLPGVRGGSAR